MLEPNALECEGEPMLLDPCGDEPKELDDGAGVDICIGGDGVDICIGGGGVDICTGGGGVDICTGGGGLLDEFECLLSLPYACKVIVPAQTIASTLAKWARRQSDPIKLSIRLRPLLPNSDFIPGS